MIEALETIRDFTALGVAGLSVAVLGYTIYLLKYKSSYGHEKRIHKIETNDIKHIEEDIREIKVDLGEIKKKLNQNTTDIAILKIRYER